MSTLCLLAAPRHHIIYKPQMTHLSGVLSGSLTLSYQTVDIFASEQNNKYFFGTSTKAKTLSIELRFTVDI